MRPPSRALPSRLTWLCLLLTALLACLGTARGDEASEKKLAEARYFLRTLRDHEGALARYAEVLAQPTLEPLHKGEALWGSAECHAALQRWEQADEAWAAILADERLPAELRSRAEQARAQRAEALRTQAEEHARETTGAEALAEREQRHQAEIERLLGRAQAAFAARKFEDARRESYAVLALDRQNADAARMLERVEQERPDRGEMIRSLLRWFETVRSESFQRLKSRAHELESVGQSRHREGDHEGADLAFRQAIALIDRSEFAAELDAERWNLVFWLRQTDADGTAKGQRFPPEPVPAAPAGDAGVRERFYALLGETFAGRDEGTADPIRFHEFAPAPAAESAPRRALGPNAFAARSIAVEQGASSLSRARWAEHWIRANVGSDWPPRTPTASAPRPRRPATGPAPRILERLEDVLFVQHTEAVQREIEALRGAFSARPPALQLDVAVFATGPGGSVRAASALRLPAPAVRESGLDAVAADLLIEECRKDLTGLEGVTALGTAQLRLTGDVGALLEVTERTEAHPLHAQLTPPPLTIPGLEAARYGLWLDLYAEDLPGLRRPAIRSAAVSVSARVRLPLPSVVLRKTDRGSDWTRLPKFADTLVETDRRVPHAGTLVLFGLPNPFVDSAAAYPDLLLLVGVRPTTEDGRPAPLPDPPSSAALGSRHEAQEHLVGSMAGEVLDDVVLDGWPEDRSAAAPVAEAVTRRAREEYLAGLLGARARLLVPGGPNPVSVRDGVASATAGPAEHVRLAAAVAWLSAQETALYDVDVRAIEVPLESTDAFPRRLGVVELPGGNAWLVPAGRAAPLDQELARFELPSSPLAASARLVTRASQQIVLRRLQSHSITRQVRVARSARTEQQRLVPLPGLAEEGLVVQVRPGLEEDGRRMTTVRVRAARLKAIESVPLRGVEALGVAVDVPRWHALLDRSAATSLSDGEALVLRLPLSTDPTRALLVRVVTRKLQ